MNRFAQRFFSIVQYLKTADYHAMGLKALIAYSNFVDQSTKFGKRLYKNSSIFRYMVDRAVYTREYVFAYLGRYKIEPFAKNWIYSASLIENKRSIYLKNRYTFEDFYEITEDPDAAIAEELTHTANTLNVLLKEDNSIREFLVSVKNNSLYLHKVINENYKELNIEFPIVFSNIKFISIEYTHPIMKSSLVINLDKSNYSIGSEILSPTFIKRYLSYQPVNYYFDYDYEVKIIDGDLKQFSLKNGQYVALNQDSYEIVSK
jgi:hypothetical protein